MNISKRKLMFQASPFLGLFALAGCAGTSGGLAPPNLAQVQGWIRIMQQELPLFVTDLQNTNQISGANLVKANTALKAFDQVSNQILAITVTNPNTMVWVNTALNSVVVIMSFVPAAAPFVPFVILFQGVLTAFVQQSAVQTPSGPVPVPAVPTPAKLSQLHKATLHWHRK